MDNKEVQKQVDAVAEPVQRNYESVIRQLRDKNAVGVVVAVNGEIVWADIFASTQLLQKYWPKLVRSYATEAVVTRAKGGEASAQRCAEVSRQSAGPPRNRRNRARHLSPDRNHRRRLQGVRANIAAAEDRISGASSRKWLTKARVGTGALARPSRAELGSGQVARQAWLRPVFISARANPLRTTSFGVIRQVQRGQFIAREPANIGRIASCFEIAANCATQEIDQHIVIAHPSLVARITRS